MGCGSTIPPEKAGAPVRQDGYAILREGRTEQLVLLLRMTWHVPGAVPHGYVFGAPDGYTAARFFAFLIDYSLRPDYLGCLSDT